MSRPNIKFLHLSEEETERIYEKVFEEGSIVVRKNHRTKRTFKILVLDEKKGKFYFTKIKKIMLLNGHIYMGEYGGFKIEEIPYEEDKKTSMAEMQKAFLKKTKLKKVEDNGYNLSDIERKSASHRSSYSKESEYEYIYDNVKIEHRGLVETIYANKRKTVVEKTNIQNRTYYTIGKQGRRITQNTIKKMIENGIFKVVTNKTNKD